MMETLKGGRRGFLGRLMGAAGLSAAAPAASLAQSRPSGNDFMPNYARAQEYRSLKQSSHDRTGGNRDAFPIAAGATQTLLESNEPGAITHIWFTIAAQSQMHLKELVLRAYWDGNPKPSVEVPVGDFFGLNLGQYQIYESEYLACSPGRSLNCYFYMPWRRGARMTVSRQGQISRVACDYGEGIVFTHRTRLHCRVEGDGNCPDGQQRCIARCE